MAWGLQGSNIIIKNKELRAKFEKYTGDDGKTYIKRKGAQD